ncbi:squalene/phytoene synthase family protein [Falsiroseomonas tokyonensis]|uniref:Squalene/phytoene synthase family protein n=1 Tax=Falsiroseomonas tokyonensis TaxID=430521 RepID=A0ABV7C1S5_9PROT|nr:squalene/phytoene synthase family protein [Falsiroseomonas tokyonensis]MBU8540076.1 squalene/phytoene synthase family protein [Falsiroseomonas tokyonensis]
MASHPLSPLGAFVRQHDPDRYLAALFAPATRREALFALIAFNHELARAREVTSTPIATLIRLQWWRDAVAEAADGRPARRHEVAGPLHQAITEGALDAAALSALIDAREAEAEPEGIPTREAFGAYLRAGPGGFAVAAGRLLGVADAALPVLQRLGALQGLAGVLRSVPAHATQGRCLLPQDALAEAGLSQEGVIAEPATAEPLRRALAEEGSAQLAKARAEDLPRQALPAALPVVLAARDLARLAAGLPIPAPRGLGDRIAIIWAGFRGRL